MMVREIGASLHPKTLEQKCQAAVLNTELHRVYLTSGPSLIVLQTHKTSPALAAAAPAGSSVSA